MQVWIFSPSRRCLLLQTRKEAGAYWQPVTGGVEPHETGEAGWNAAALREAVEETGFQFPVEPQPADHEFEFDTRWGPRARERVYSLMATEERAPRLDPLEHENFRWCDASIALKDLRFETNRDGLKAAFFKRFGEKMAAAAFAFAALTMSAVAMAPQAEAAQNAQVSLDGATIRKSPQPEAEILESRRKGDTLRISSQSRDGWFKTRTSAGEIGWVRQEDVAAEATSQTFNHGNLDTVERKESKRDIDGGGWKQVGVKVGAGPFFHMPGDMNRTLGRPTYKIHRGQFFFGSVGLSFWKDLALGLRVERYHSRARILSYDIETSSNPVLVGAEYTFYRTPRWRFSFQLYGGIGVGHQSVIIAADQPDNPNMTTLSGSPATALGTINATYKIWDWLGVFGEIGARYSASLTTYSVSNEFNGQSPYFVESSGARTQFRVSDSGPHIAIGLEARF